MNYEYSRDKKATRSPIAAPSAFDLEKFDHTKVHFHPTDKSKIYNPKTGKYVNIEGMVGQRVIDEYGYPDEQVGGFSLTDINKQITDSLSSLYNNVLAGWNSLTEPEKEEKKAKAKKFVERTKDKVAKAYKGKNRKGTKGRNYDF